MAGSVSDPLGRSLQFNPRRHLLVGLDLDEREHTAIGGDEHIKHFRWTVGDGTRAICLDGIRASEDRLANNIPIKVSRNDRLHLTVAVIHVLPCNGEQPLVLPGDYNPILGEQIRPVQRSLQALRPGGVLSIGKPCPDGRYGRDGHCISDRTAMMPILLIRFSPFPPLASTVLLLGGSHVYPAFERGRMPVYGDWAFLHRVVVGQHKSVRSLSLQRFSSAKLRPHLLSP